MSHPSSVHRVRLLPLVQSRVEPYLTSLKERWCQSCHCSTLSSAPTHKALGICAISAGWKTIIALSWEYCLHLAPLSLYRKPYFLISFSSTVNLFSAFFWLETGILRTQPILNRCVSSSHLLCYTQRKFIPLLFCLSGFSLNLVIQVQFEKDNIIVRFISLTCCLCFVFGAEIIYFLFRSTHH